MDCRLYCFCDDWVEIESSNDYKIDEKGNFILIHDAGNIVEDIDRTSMYESNVINVPLSISDISKNISSHRFIFATVYSKNKEFDKIALENYLESNKDSIRNGDIVCITPSEFVYDDEMRIILGTNIVEITDALKSKYNINSDMYKYRDVKSLVKALNDYYGFNKFIMFIDGKRVN